MIMHPHAGVDWNHRRRRTRVPPCSLVVVVGIEFSEALRAQSVREFRLGMGLDVTLEGLPALVFIL